MADLESYSKSAIILVVGEIYALYNKSLGKPAAKI